MTQYQSVANIRRQRGRWYLGFPTGLAARAPCVCLCLTSVLFVKCRGNNWPTANTNETALTPKTLLFCSVKRMLSKCVLAIAKLTQDWCFCQGERYCSAL